ncbi:MAG: hypothetical protein ACLGHQ_00390, partial [Acidimicrobiia bacterium]
MGRTRLAAAVVGVVGVIALAGCGVDADVVILEASRTPQDAVVAPSDDPTPATIPPPTIPPTDPPTATTPPPTTEPAPTMPTVVEPELFVDVDLASVVDVDAGKPGREHDPFVAVAFTDVERW